MKLKQLRWRSLSKKFLEVLKQICSNVTGTIHQLIFSHQSVYSVLLPSFIYDYVEEFRVFSPLRCQLTLAFWQSMLALILYKSSIAILISCLDLKDLLSASAALCRASKYDIFLLIYFTPNVGISIQTLEFQMNIGSLVRSPNVSTILRTQHPLTNN